VRGPPRGRAGGLRRQHVSGGRRVSEWVGERELVGGRLVVGVVRGCQRFVERWLIDEQRGGQRQRERLRQLVGERFRRIERKRLRRIERERLG
jgi:hypothetical protein